MSEKQQVIDLDTMSMAELKALADAEAQPQVEIDEPVADDQPRDDKGRFAKPEETPEAPPAPVEPAFAEMIIDLGDGSGAQIFRGKDYQEVAQKLAEAQKHATKKIREQAEKLRDLEARKKAEEEQIDSDDEFILSQEMMSRPTEAIKKAFKKMTGYDITEFKTVAERAKAMEAADAEKEILRKQEAAATKFMQDNPDYIANQRNGQRLEKAYRLLEHEAKSRGEELDYETLLMKAYQDLKEGGLLELKSEDATAEREEPTGARNARIEQREEVVPTQRSSRGSSLSSRSGNAAPVRNSEPSLDDLYDMPIEKLRQLANQGK